MINDWESRVVIEHLDSRRNGGRINHHWMMKNMMGMLMEYFTTKWSGSRETVQFIMICMIQTDEKLNSLEVNFNWKHYAIAHGAGENEGHGNTDRNGVVGETSLAAKRSAAPNGENLENFQLMTLVTNDPLHAKRVHEELEGNMASRPLLEAKPLEEISTQNGPPKEN